MRAPRAPFARSRGGASPRAQAALVMVALAGCASSTAPDVGLEGLALESVAPNTIIPGTKVRIVGSSFVDTQWGSSTLHLVGSADGQSIDVRWPARFVDFSTMEVDVTAGMLDELGGDVDFDGTARIDVIATSDDQTYSSDVVSLELEFREQLTPTATSLQADQVIFVNDKIEVAGSNYLLGGDEGVTVAKLSGCFDDDGGSSSCVPITEIEIPMVPKVELERNVAVFPFSPRVAGIKEGTFVGRIVVENQQPGKPAIATDPIDVTYDLATPQIFDIKPRAVSLGQYANIEGGGFVGGDTGGNTEIELAGTFRTDGGTAPVDLVIVPQFVEGKLVRYVVNSEDELGVALGDVFTVTGEFTGTATPVINFEGTTVRGSPKNVVLEIAPVKQVVYLDYRPTYVEGLRDFGLRAVDKRIRERIHFVVDRAYEGVNIEFREEPPQDFELYEHVELVGVDPNNQGLFGYDNSPGKDNGNRRLYDRLGGVNALTQQDGYAGYGGVFVRSLMGFSKHPGNFAMSVPGADDLFDDVFDPFRADLGNEPVRGSDLVGDLEPVTSGDQCPATERGQQIQCAIYVLGNLIGGTLAHEIGHSLGLANPYAEGFHNAGDAPDRLMDGGGDRPFVERAEMMGQGPGVFCDEEYTYLRTILPTQEPNPSVTRPTCF